MAITESQQRLLQQGCTALGLTVTEDQHARLNGYLAGLIKWNQAYNLTAIRDPEEMVIKHLLDSLAVQVAISGTNILDVGTGPGLPGIPLAILMPQRQFTLLDSNGKKTRFLTQMKHQLVLDNVEVANQRIESLAPQKTFDTITCRAFTSLQEFVDHCLHLLQPEGELLALKGKIPTDEIAALDQQQLQVAIEKITVPYLNDERHLIRIKRAQ